MKKTILLPFALLAVLSSQVFFIPTIANAVDNSSCPGAMPMEMPTMGAHPHALGNGTTLEAAGYTLNLLTKKFLIGQPTVIKFNLTDPKKQIVTKFLLDMGKMEHTIIFSSDYKTYIHKHAEVDKKGNFSVPVIFPTAGSYHMDVDFSVPLKGQSFAGAQLIVGTDLVVGSKSTFTMPIKPSCSSTSNGYKISLNRTTLPLTHDTLMVNVSKKGQPVLFGKFLGTMAHLVIIRDSDRRYGHFHPMNADGSMPPMWSSIVDVTKGNTTTYTDLNTSSNDIIPYNPKEVNPTPGMLHFMTEPPGAGRYTAFLQFIDGTKLQTLTFTIDAK